MVYYWEKRNKEFLLPSVFELAGHQRLTVKREIKNVGQLRPVVEGRKNMGQAICNLTRVKEIVVRTDRLQNESQQMFVFWDQGKEEKRLMIGQNPKSEVAPSSVSRNRGKRISVFEERCCREQMGRVSCQDSGWRSEIESWTRRTLCLQARAIYM